MSSAYVSTTNDNSVQEHCACMKERCSVSRQKDATHDTLSPMSAASTSASNTGAAARTNCYASTSPSARSDSSSDSTPQCVESSGSWDESASKSSAATVSASVEGGDHGTSRSSEKEMPYSLSDLGLVECFYELARLEDPDPRTLKLLLRAVLFMRSCNYCMQDVCVVLAHASIYFNDVTVKCGKMVPGEAGNIVVLLMYMAHAYVQDENCPLKYWHEYLFGQYCSLKTLDKALMCMMKLRGYILRVDDEEMQRRLSLLVASCDKSLNCVGLN